MGNNTMRCVKAGGETGDVLRVVGLGTWPVTAGIENW